MPETAKFCGKCKQKFDEPLTSSQNNKKALKIAGISVISLALVIIAILVAVNINSNNAPEHRETYQPQQMESISETAPETFIPVQTELLPEETPEPEGLSIEEQFEIYTKFNDAVFGIYCDEQELFIGSGFIISETGMAITAAHVLTGSVELWAKLENGSWVEIIGAYVYDELSDIAVIQIKSSDEPYPYMEIENKDNIIIGDIVYVIGTSGETWFL